MDASNGVDIMNVTKLPDLTKGIPDCHIEDCTNPMFGNVGGDLWVCRECYLKYWEALQKKEAEKAQEKMEFIKNLNKGDNNESIDNE